MRSRFEAVVVGLGPAGMAAAAVLAENGVETAVIDSQPLPGGQVYRQLPRQFQRSGASAKKERTTAEKALMARFQRIADRITFFRDATVFGFFEPDLISIFSQAKVLDLRFGKLIICEGALERIVPFPGWTLPGVMTAGGLQRFIKQQRLLPGRRILLAGTGPLLASVAASAAGAGASRVWLCEAAPSADTLRFLPALLRRPVLLAEAAAIVRPFLARKIVLRQPCGLIAAHGNRRVQGATIARLDAEGVPLSGTEKEIAVDVIAVNHGFLPQSRLSRLAGCRHRFLRDRDYWSPETDAHQQTSRRHVYAAGDGAGIGGAHLAALEGQIAGWHIAATLGKIDAAECKRHLLPLQTATAKWRRYAEALFRSYRLRRGLFEVIARETIVCRCEGVTAGEIYDAMAAGASDMKALKTTRFAMGPCQGRTCESVVAELMRRRGIKAAAQGQLSIRPPLLPLPIASLAKTDPGNDN